MPGRFDIFILDDTNNSVRSGSKETSSSKQHYSAYLLHKGIRTGRRHRVEQRRSEDEDYNSSISSSLPSSRQTESNIDAQSVSAFTETLVDKWHNSRLKAEYVPAEQLDQAFATRKGRVLEVIHNGEPAELLQDLAAKMPDTPGLYLVCARAPRCSSWVPVYWGQANTSLRQRIMRNYFHASSGTFGPSKDRADIYLSFLDMQRRGFSFQLRFKVAALDVVRGHDQDVEQLEQHDFALRCHMDDGSRGVRQVELPGRRQLNFFPPIHRHLTNIYNNERMQYNAKQNAAAAAAARGMMLYARC